MPGVMHLVTQCGSSSSVYCTLFCILSALTDLVVMKVMGEKKNINVHVHYSIGNT